MKRRVLSPLLLLICVFYSSSVEAQNTWKKFVVDAPVSFSVDVPESMQESVQEIETAVGKLKLYSYAHQGVDEDLNYLYLINVVQYPETTFPQDSVDLIAAFLEGSIESTVVRVGGELLYSSDLENGLGKLYRIKYNDGNAVIKGKSIISQNAFLNVQVFTTKEKSLNDEMDFFLDSFRIQN